MMEDYMSYFLKKYTTEIWIDMLFPNYMRKKKRYYWN